MNYPFKYLNIKYVNNPFKYLNIKYVNYPFKYLILIVLGGRWVRMVELILLLVSDCSPVEDGLQFIDEGLWRKLILDKYVELELTTRNCQLPIRARHKVLLIVCFINPMSVRYNRNWDRKGWPGSEIKMY